MSREDDDVETAVELEAEEKVEEAKSLCWLVAGGESRASRISHSAHSALALSGWLLSYVDDAGKFEYGWIAGKLPLPPHTHTTTSPHNCHPGPGLTEPPPPTRPAPATTDAADGLWALRAACRGGFDAVVVDSCNVPKVWITPTALPRSTISIFLEPGIDVAGAASFAEEEGWDGVVSSPEEAVQFLTGRTVVAEEAQPDAELDLDALHPAVARFAPTPSLPGPRSVHQSAKRSSPSFCAGACEAARPTRR